MDQNPETPGKPEECYNFDANQCDNPKVGPHNERQKKQTTTTTKKTCWGIHP